MARSKEEKQFNRLDRQVMGEETVIPVVKEQLTISSRQVTTGEVVVNTKVNSETVTVPLTTINTSYRELRIPTNRVVETMPQTRMDGDNIIIPVVREEEIVVKRLVLVEEIHLIRTTEVNERTQTVELRAESATVSRSAPNQEFIAMPE